MLVQSPFQLKKWIEPDRGLVGGSIELNLPIWSIFLEHLDLQLLMPTHPQFQLKK